MTDEERREAIREQVIASRRAQGLPDTIQDPVVLAQLAALLVEADTDGDLYAEPETAGERAS